MILRAKYLIDSQFAVLDNHAIRINAGRIQDIGSVDHVGGEPVLDLGDSVLLPGFVNAHTHLELGFAAGKIPPTPDFTHWLRRLLEIIRATSANETLFDESVEAGLRECLRSGTTLIGDITRKPSRTRAVIAGCARRPTVVSFGEIIAFGKLRDAGKERLAAAVDEEHRSESLFIGVSPHATYSVEPRILRASVKEAQNRKLPLCIHAAEVQDEHDYTLRASGSLRTYFERLGVWDDAVPTIGLLPIEYLAHSGALGSATLLAHCNYVSDDEIELLRETRTSVAYCPRTHHAFSHDPHPFRKMMARGVNVCLGTDSLASNPSLSILDEMRFLKRHHPSLDAQTILRMGTKAGADALGFSGITGLLRQGWQADLTAIPLDRQGPKNPIENIMYSNHQPLAWQK